MATVRSKEEAFKAGVVFGAAFPDEVPPWPFSSDWPEAIPVEFRQAFQFGVLKGYAESTGEDPTAPRPPTASRPASPFVEAREVETEVDPREAARAARREVSQWRKTHRSRWGLSGRRNPVLPQHAERMAPGDVVLLNRLEAEALDLAKAWEKAARRGDWRRAEDLDAEYAEQIERLEDIIAEVLEGGAEEYPHVGPGSSRLIERGDVDDPTVAGFDPLWERGGEGEGEGDPGIEIPGGERVEHMLAALWAQFLAWQKWGDRSARFPREDEDAPPTEKTFAHTARKRLARHALEQGDVFRGASDAQIVEAAKEAYARRFSQREQAKEAVLADLWERFLLWQKTGDPSGFPQMFNFPPTEKTFAYVANKQLHWPARTLPGGRWERVSDEEIVAEAKAAYARRGPRLMRRGQGRK